MSEFPPAAARPHRDRGGARHGDGRAPVPDAQQAPWWSTTRGDVGLALAEGALIVTTAFAGIGSMGWTGAWLGASHTVTMALAIGAAVPGLLGVALRHRRFASSVVLIAASTALCVAIGQSVGGFVLLFELFFTLTLLGSERARAVTRLVAVGLTAALIIAAFVGGGGLRDALTASLVAGVSLWLPVAWGSDLRLSDRLRASESRRADDAAATSAARAELAVSRERTRMAGELHDHVSGHLSAIALQSQAALASPDPEVRERVLTQIRSGSLEALGQMRSLIDVLHAGRAQAEPAGSLADFPALAERARAAGHDVDLAIRVDAPLAPETQTVAFRAASEGITNALKHAPGARIVLLVEPVPGGVEVRVSDDGAAPGIAGPGITDGLERRDEPLDAGGNGLGLRQLRARAESMGGTLRAGPLPGSRPGVLPDPWSGAASAAGPGWVLSVRLPSEDEPELPATPTSPADTDTDTRELP